MFHHVTGPVESSEGPARPDIRTKRIPALCPITAGRFLQLHKGHTGTHPETEGSCKTVIHGSLKLNVHLEASNLFP